MLPSLSNVILVAGSRPSRPPEKLYTRVYPLMPNAEVVIRIATAIAAQSLLSGEEIGLLIGPRLGRSRATRRLRVWPGTIPLQALSCQLSALRKILLVRALIMAAQSSQVL